MANNPGAKKAIRKIARRTEVNKARRSRVRTYVRKFEEALAAGDRHGGAVKSGRRLDSARRTEQREHRRVVAAWRDRGPA